MIRRLAVALAVLVTAASPTDVAGAGASHEPDRFTACAAVSAGAARCHRRGVTSEHGRTVFLRGRVVPAHPGFGEVLRRMPRSRREVRVGTIGVAPDGRIRWSWVPKRRHIRPAAPYRFVFRLPGIGRSNPVPVWIVHPH